MSSRTTFLRERLHLALVCTACLRVFSAATATEPLDRPGNIYVEAQEVRVRVPAEVAGEGFAWRAEDIEGSLVAEGRTAASSSPPSELPNLGRPGIGYYRVRFLDDAGEQVGWTSAAVLARLRAPVPEASPICLDSATAWFARDDTASQETYAKLAALAGVSWVRDRLRWREVQPERDRFTAKTTTYDTAAELQHEAGLKVLQVFHDTPTWARDKGRRGGGFCADLRHVHRFSESMARRFQGRVQAWEPWNEANVKTFGGHTMDQMCSWQKAAYLGFKAADSNLTVGWNASAAAPTRQQTRAILLNRVWPYFDTYNIHTYDWPHSYFDLWAPAREAASGRPLWITEADRGMKHENVPPWYDLSPRGERLKAELMAQSYAQSLFAGAAKHFHFVLGHYCEPNGVQFGLLRQDFTPRPAYVALAAVGRFLAGARSLGRRRPVGDARVYAFRAAPNGLEQDVLVVWAEKHVDWPQRGRAEARWPLPEAMEIDRIHDFVGRDLGRSPPPRISSSPMFVLLPRGESDALDLARPPTSTRRDGEPSNMVLQILAPSSARVRVEDRPWSESYAYGFRPDETSEFSLAVYNFGPRPVGGTVEVVQAPSGWRLSTGTWRVNVPAMGRRVFPFAFDATSPEGGEALADGWIVLEGKWGGSEGSALAFRMKARD